jgi:hypothetical protein
MGGACGTRGGNEKCIQNFHRKTRGERSLIRNRRSCEDNIRTDQVCRMWIRFIWLRTGTCDRLL